MILLRPLAATALLLATLAAQPCLAPPATLTFWAPLDETSGPAFANIAKPPLLGTHFGGSTAAPGQVLGARTYDGVSQWSDYPDGPEVNPIGIYFGSANLGHHFSLEAWVEVPAATDLSGVRTIVDKRASGTFGLRGYAFYLYDGRLGCQVADGTYSNYIAPAATHLVAPGSGWHHVAMVLDRQTPNGCFLAVDGVPWFFDASGHAGSMVNPAPFRIGARVVNGSPDAFFAGRIDEVSVHQKDLSPADVGFLHAAGPHGRCKSRCSVPSVTTFAANQTCVAIQARIENRNVAPRTYTWSLQGVPASTLSPSCTVAGPPSFTPSSGIVTVPAMGHVILTSAMARPTGLGMGCFSMVAHDGTHTVSAWGGAVAGSSPFDAASPCGPLAVDTAFVGAGPGRLAPGSFRVRNTGLQTALLDYRIEIRDPEGNPDLSAAAFAGRAPGTPLAGMLTLAPGQVVELPFSARFVRRDPLRDYAIVLLDLVTGTPQVLGSRVLQDAPLDRLTLEPSVPEPGALALRVLSGPPQTTVYTFLTLGAGPETDGWLFGLAPTITEFQEQFAAASAGVAPFALIPDATGRADWMLSAGIPAGLDLRFVSLALDPQGTGVLASYLAEITTR